MKDQILSELRTLTFGRNLYTFASIDSTNTCARTLADTGATAGTVVWTDHQTAGKGRLGRTWADDPGTNLLFSVVLRDLPLSKRNWVSYYVSEAVAGGIEKEVGTDIAAKWPNDLLLDGRKVGGILLEASDGPQNRYVIAGIGINVNQAEFPEDLKEKATSLAMATGSPIDRKDLFLAIMDTMETLFDDLRKRGDAAIIEAWKNRCQTFGTSITVRSGEERIDGTAIGLSEDGGLLLETSRGLRTVHAGDVTLNAGLAAGIG